MAHVLMLSMLPNLGAQTLVEDELRLALELLPDDQSLPDSHVRHQMINAGHAEQYDQTQLDAPK